MAKGRSKTKREAKKPKADKKPSLAAATFLTPQPIATTAKSKGAK